MAVAYSNPASFADLITALNSKSLITTIYYQSATEIVFSTPLTDKYIDLVYTSGRITMKFIVTLLYTTISNETHAAGNFTLAQKPIIPGSDALYSATGGGGTHWIRDTHYTINSTTGAVTNISMAGTVYCNYQYVTGNTWITFADYNSGAIYLLHCIVETTYMILVSESLTVVANEAKTISGGTFTLTNKPIKPLTDDFWSGSGKTGTHWVRNTNYTINNLTGVVTNINMSGTVYANYSYQGGANLAYLGATDNGKAIAFGLCAFSSITIYGKYNSCWNLTDMYTMHPLVFSQSCDDGGNVLTQKLAWKHKTSGQLLKNGSDPASTLGIKSSSGATPDCVLGANYLYWHAPSYMIYDYYTVLTNLLIEW